MFCQKCGVEIKDENASFCPSCGSATDSITARGIAEEALAIEAEQRKAKCSKVAFIASCIGTIFLLFMILSPSPDTIMLYAITATVVGWNVLYKWRPEFVFSLILKLFIAYVYGMFITPLVCIYRLYKKFVKKNESEN